MKINEIVTESYDAYHKAEQAFMHAQSRCEELIEDHMKTHRAQAMEFQDQVERLEYIFNFYAYNDEEYEEGQEPEGYEEFDIDGNYITSMHAVAQKMDQLADQFEASVS